MRSIRQIQSQQDSIDQFLDRFGEDFFKYILSNKAKLSDLFRDAEPFLRYQFPKNAITFLDLDAFLGAPTAAAIDYIALELGNLNESVDLDAIRDTVIRNNVLGLAIHASDFAGYSGTCFGSLALAIYLESLRPDQIAHKTLIMGKVLSDMVDPSKIDSIKFDQLLADLGPYRIDEFVDFIIDQRGAQDSAKLLFKMGGALAHSRASHITITEAAKIEPRAGKIVDSPRKNSRRVAF